jgi:hypothetical protein
VGTIEEIEVAIEQLPRDELLKLADWLSSKFENEWDKQIQEDIGAGRLDHLAREALTEFHAGRTKPFPPMKSMAATSFWKNYHRLPEEIQKVAVKQYRLWLRDPRRTSLQLKKVPRLLVCTRDRSLSSAWHNGK